MEIELFIHEENCDHCKPSLNFLSAVVGSLKKFNIKLIVHQVLKNKDLGEKRKIDFNQLPVIVLPSGCQISGQLSHDLIGTLVCSLLAKSKVPVQSAERFELNKKEGEVLLELASTIIEFQAAFALRRDRSYTFIIKESTAKVPLERYRELSKFTKILLLTNFEKRPDPQLYELGLEENVYLGHIIREDIVLGANLIVWRDRANHITYFRAKRKGNDSYVGSCSTLLGDGKKFIKEFFKPLFSTSSTINSDGAPGIEQNRIVASVKELNTDLEQLIKK